MVLSAVKRNKSIKGVVRERKNFPDRSPFLREVSKAVGEQAFRCVEKSCPHCKKQEEGKVGHV